MPALSEKMFALLLALMMLGDARAAKFTYNIALRYAVDACVSVSPQGNCCAPQGSADSGVEENIVRGADANDGTCNEDTNIHLQYWDVSSVANMESGKLLCFMSPFRALCAVLQGVCSCNLTLCFLVSFVRFFPLRTVFTNAEAFDQDLRYWDVSSVTDMRSSKLLSFTSPFRALCAVLQGVCSCNLTLCFLVSFVRFFPSRTVFNNAKSFDQNLSAWKVSSVTDMRAMFSGAQAFNQDLSDWNVSSVTNMGYSKLLCFMSPFRALCAVLQGVCSCDLTLCFLVSFVRFFPSRTVFNNAKSFDQDLSAWDVSSVTDMSYSKLLCFTSPFRALCAVLQGVCSCDLTLCFLVSFVRFFPSRTVFSGTYYFNQDLSDWDVSSVTNMRSSKLLSFTSPFRALCAVLQGVCSCDLTLCFLVSFVRFFTSRTVFSSADAFDQILCGPSWVVSEAAFAAGTSLFAGDNAGVTTFSSIASSACCPAGTYWIVEDPADCKTWDGIRKEIREEILSDEQDILQALAARQSCSS